MFHSYVNVYEMVNLHFPVVLLWFCCCLPWSPDDHHWVTLLENRENRPPAVCSRLADREAYIRDVSIYWMEKYGRTSKIDGSIYFLDSQNWKNMAEPDIRDVSVYFLPNLTVDLPF